MASFNILIWELWNGRDASWNYICVKYICIKNASSYFHLSTPDENRQANEDRHEAIAGSQGSLVWHHLCVNADSACIGWPVLRDTRKAQTSEKEAEKA